MASLLNQLRGLTTVDCDTLDAHGEQHNTAISAENKAIVLAEITKLDANGKLIYQTLIDEIIPIAHWMFGNQTDATVEELASELLAVGLALRFIPHLNGFIHIQTNPKWCYSTEKTVKNAERIVAHLKHLAPDFDTSRICIKIPATWEGLQACRELERRHSIATLATIVFSMEQVALAVDAGCRYVAPYVNELRVHFDATYTDANKDRAALFCGAAQRYCDEVASSASAAEAAHGSLNLQMQTQVLAASLTSVEEVMRLAGAVKHITVSPPLLMELEATPAAGWPGASTVGAAAAITGSRVNGDAVRLRELVRDQSQWRLAFTRAEAGESERKLGQAIGIFCDMQDQIERLVRRWDLTGKKYARG
ncbi:uncharacterized protein B0T23DRAFT_326714 [Neurospora hispaniola]|uniref:Transaldolase n=1 Tax=Neurospora hispaniola TaxID=588809 RepID=A0AAJ0HZ44_9PEZI|nr:hypothetical protein B0T23DRAFT_326714 [Neurospora hispaniola]